MTSDQQQGRQQAVDDIITWAQEMDGFWKLAVPESSRRRALEEMSDDDLREEWRWARTQKRAFDRAQACLVGRGVA